MYLYLEIFNVYHKEWLTYSGGTDRPDEPCYNFSVSNDRTEMVNFPTRIPGCDWLSDALSDCLFLQTLIYVLQWLFLPWEILFMLLPQFPLTFLQIKKGMTLFIKKLIIYNLL